MSSLPCLFISIKTQTLEINSTRPNLDPISYGCVIFHEKTRVRREKATSCPWLWVRLFQTLPRLLDFFTMVLFNYLKNAVDLFTTPAILSVVVSAQLSSWKTTRFGELSQCNQIFVRGIHSPQLNSSGGAQNFHAKGGHLVGIVMKNMETEGGDILLICTWRENTP